jgi:methyltransferase (TIGR00027 family)
MKDVGVAGTVRVMCVRTRFMDEALERAVVGGATQVVILGAGFDTRAYRCRRLLSHVTVFEVDRPAMQALKTQRVNEVLGAPPVNLTYVAADFQHEDLLHVLMRHGYDSAQRTFFILEGVTMYLAEEAVRGTLRFVAAHPPGSGIVFDFVYRAMVEIVTRIDVANLSEAEKVRVERSLRLRRDEPWVFGVPVGGEREFLREFGLELREALTIGEEESVRRYLTRADGTQVGAPAMAEARARMTERVRPFPQGRTERQRLLAYQLADAVVPPGVPVGCMERTCICRSSA